MPTPGARGFRLADIAARLGGDVLGDAETVVVRVATLASAGPGASLSCPIPNTAAS